MIRLVSATGSFARSMVPLKAMPVIPVSMMEGISSKVIPPDGDDGQMDICLVHLLNNGTVTF